LDFVFLPINLYAKRLNFTAVNSIESPSLLFPLALLYIPQRHNALLNKLGVYTILWFGIWAAGSQQIRFLLPVFPILAVFTASALCAVQHAVYRRILTATLISGALITSLYYQAESLKDSSLIKVVLGMQSKSQYLEKTLADYNAQTFIRQSLPDESRVLFLWDGKSYYCGAKCTPDAEQTAAIRLTINNPRPEELARKLKAEGITHIFLSRSDAYWFMYLHDPQKQHRNAFVYFERVFLPACGKSIYSEADYSPQEIYTIICE
jgi:hypothetical protein